MKAFGRAFAVMFETLQEYYIFVNGYAGIVILRQ